jgi:predicted YcjX-like family ATPase
MVIKETTIKTDQNGDFVMPKALPGAPRLRINRWSAV